MCETSCVVLGDLILEKLEEQKQNDNGNNSAVQSAVGKTCENSGSLPVSRKQSEALLAELSGQDVS